MYKRQGYINTIISKKSLRDIISDVIKVCGVAKACLLYTSGEVAHHLRNTPNVIGFLGGSEKPVPLRQSEVNRMRR